MRVCLDCPTLITHGTRCARHRAARERERGTPTARGYGVEHRKLRAAFRRRMDDGESFTCWRCGRPVDPDAFDLGHDDHDRGVYRGPECRPCNRATSSRRP